MHFFFSWESNGFNSLYLFKVYVEQSMNLEPKTVYKMYRGTSFTSWWFLMPMYKNPAQGFLHSFANSEKQGHFGSLLSVSPGIIPTTALLLSSIIISEFMQNIEPDFLPIPFPLQILCRICLLTIVEITRIFVNIVRGLVGDGRLCKILLHHPRETGLHAHY